MRIWVALGESETQEFKETTGQRTDGCKTLCGMLNTRGGRVFYGVDALGQIKGQQVTDKTVEDVTHEIRQIEPPALPSVDRVPVGRGREVLVVQTDRGARRPYGYKGQAGSSQTDPNWPPFGLTIPNLSL